MDKIVKILNKIGKETAKSGMKIGKAFLRVNK